MLAFVEGRRGRIVPRINGNQPFPAIIEAPTAPRPVAWMCNELLPDRIRVHVVKFLENFYPGIHIEIVIAPLPESPQQILLFGKTEPQLAFRSAFPSPQAARHSLLEHLYDFRGRDRGRFIDEQVQMFWHDDIADQSEAIASADFLEDLHHKIPCPRGCKKRPSLVTAKRDEMKIAVSSDALEILGHRSEEWPTLCKKQKPQRVGHPGRFSYHCMVLFASGYFTQCACDGEAKPEGCATRPGQFGSKATTS